eukprot:scaffold1148_cov65-Skeletonema_marinoi.AAC.2
MERLRCDRADRDVPPNIPPTSRFQRAFLTALVSVLKHWYPFISSGVRWWLCIYRAGAAQCPKL